MNRKLELSKPLYKQNLLYVDDLRNPPNKLRQEYNIIICRNYEEAIYELDKILSDEVEVIEEEEIEEIDELRIAGITTEEMESKIKLKEVILDSHGKKVSDKYDRRYKNRI